VEADELAARGLDVMPLMQDAGGRDIHPKNTHGVLIRIYPSAMAADLEQELGHGLGPISTRQSRAHLPGISRVSVAVGDLDNAVAVYRDRLGLPTRLQGGVSASGARSALCTPSSGGQIELRSLVDDREASGGKLVVSPRERGEGMYALVLE